MTTYISIIRGINVSGQKTIKMDALKTMYESLAFANVQTYIQSGNVLFQYNDVPRADLQQKIAEEIKNIFGFDVPVLVMDIEKLKEIIANNPFIVDAAKDIAYQHVTFLYSKPETKYIESIRQNQAQDESFALTDAAVYLYCPNGYGRTKLTNTFFEKKLNVIATTRNWKTTIELLNIAERLSTGG